MHIDSNTIRGHIETIILSFLSECDRYGYELGILIAERTSLQYEIKEPSLYSAIRRLEAQKLISGYWGDESQGGRRKYYTLTAEGLARLNESKQEWIYAKKIIDILLKTDGTANANTAILPHIDQKVR